jgi:hypothetical protein
LWGFFSQLRLGEAAMEKFVHQQNLRVLKKQLAETPNYLIFGHLLPNKVLGETAMPPRRHLPHEQQQES